MAVNYYRFVTDWTVTGSVEQVSAILEDPLDFPDWWPDVYLAVKELEPGVFALHTKGWLPYRLTWFSRSTESRHPYGFSLKAWGDLEGNGVWTFTADGTDTKIRYEWSVTAEKPLLRYLSPLLRPFFAANHRWAMQRGEKGLRAELQRRFATQSIKK